jgi:hypothetical protein
MTPPRAVATATGTTPGSTELGRSGLSTASSAPGYAQTGRREVSTYEVLRYIRSTFDDEDVLDSVPLDAAGNPGAWHAWRTHRRHTAGKALPGQSDGSSIEGNVPGESTPATGPVPASTKRPGEWNWEGVWEERVKRGIAASLSEGMLYGNAGSTDELVRRLSWFAGRDSGMLTLQQINFLNMEDAEVERVKSNLLRTLGAAAQ